MLVAALDAALGTVRFEVADPDAHRHAGAATIAQRLVHEMMGAAKTGVRKGVVLRDGVRSAKFRHQLGLQTMRQVRATHRRSRAEEPQSLDVLTDEHGPLM